MSKVRRTIYSAAMQTASYFNKEHVIQENTTLNEKFGIQQGVFPNVGERVSVQYMAIGDRGHEVTIGGSGRSKTKAIAHRVTDAACFNHVPFVLRLITNDLTVQERSRYRLRKIESHNGQQYVAYYGRLLNTTTSAVNTQVNTRNGNSVTTDPFIPTANNLNPTVPENYEATSSTVNVSMVVTIAFDTWDVAELRNVARILYGSEEEAVVSEIALVSGVDRTVQGQGIGNNTISYTEVIGAQVALHITSYYDLENHNDGFSMSIDGGITEAMDMLA